MLRSKRVVGVGVEIGIDQVGDLAPMAVDLDDVGAVDFTEVGSAAALVDALGQAREEDWLRRGDLLR